ncbi:MAG TPA: ABC transporter permease [Polyangiaceae bacterium]
MISSMPNVSFSIAAFAPGKPTAKALNFFARVWFAMGLGGRIAVVAAIALVIVCVVFLGLRRFGRGRRGHLLRNLLTGVCAAGLLGLGAWARMLPEPRGSYFVLWHQFVRVGAAVCGMGFALGSVAIVMERLMDRLELSGFVPYIASRHVRAQKSGFLTAISILSITGVALSSLALCAVVSIMGGFGADLKRKILGNNAHVTIEGEQPGGFDRWRELLNDARLVQGVRAATPIAAGEAMASSSSNTAGVIVRGVDPVTIGTVIDLLQNIEVGKFEYLVKPDKLAHLPPEEPIGIGAGGEIYLKGPEFQAFENPDLDPDVKEVLRPEDTYPGLIVGRELAKTLHVYVGDDITLVSSIGDLTPMGVVPKSRRFRIAAIFYSGMYEYDQSHVYMNLENAQQFLELEGRVTALEIKANDTEQATSVRQRINDSLNRTDVRVRDWKEMNRNLFSALKLEKIATFIILSIAIAVASFCIICTLLLMVTEKSKEIAILKALGTTDEAILRIFMTEGMLIGGIGTVCGVVTGLAVTLGLLSFGVRLDPDVYYVDRLPISVDPLDYTLVALSAMAITTIATIYPALAASRLRPVDGIRYE